MIDLHRLCRDLIRSIMGGTTSQPGCARTGDPVAVEFAETGAFGSTAVKSTCLIDSDPINIATTS